MKKGREGRRKRRRRKETKRNETKWLALEYSSRFISNISWEPMIYQVLFQIISTFVKLIF